LPTSSQGFDNQVFTPALAKVSCIKLAFSVRINGCPGIVPFSITKKNPNIRGVCNWVSSLTVIMPSVTSPDATTHPDVPPFPAPQTFDILPEIYALVARLQLPSNPTTDPSASQPADSLAPKDLPAAAVPIKLKIQKARAAVQSLPDLGRTVEEQELEIRALESRNESLRARVRDLAALARQAREADITSPIERAGS
jgi:hypothetical protein